MKRSLLAADTIETYYPKTLLPELPGLGWRTFSQGTPGGPRPSESRAFEICFIDRGSVEWWINGQLYEAGPKSLFINKPGEWHGGNSGMVQPCEMYWLQFFFPPDGDLPGLREEVVTELKSIYEGMERRYFAASSQVEQLFEQLLNEQRQPGLLAESCARAIFQQILITSARDYLAQTRLEYSLGIKRVLGWMDKHLAEDAHSETLAELAAMSVAQFYKVFHQEVGLSPADYHVRQRLFIAKQRLRNSDTSITGIALELGFSSSQYFATVFKKFVGLTPGEYRHLRKKV